MLIMPASDSVMNPVASALVYKRSGSGEARGAGGTFGVGDSLAQDESHIGG